MSWIHVLLVLAGAQQSLSSGVFELRLLAFDNAAGRDDLGQCCEGGTPPPSPPPTTCNEACVPRFRVCLKEYQTHIDTKSPCTFGDNTTTTPADGFTHAIQFPFRFIWPRTFSLMVEAWHGNASTSSSSSSSEVLIARTTRSSALEIGRNWTYYEHVGKFTTMRFEYRATCDDHYYGKGCENFCRPRDDNFGHYTCSSSGEQICIDGWEGQYCEKPICFPGCDSEHGHCLKPWECRCKPGWEGALCDQCQRYPGCDHGTCENRWECMCEEGWGGLFCNQDLNFCTNHKPCRNGGTCFNTGQGSYTCQCPAGFAGTECEILENDCQQEAAACANGGTCARTANATYHACVCPAGYSGALCEETSQSCADAPCLNGARCIDHGGGGYQCVCAPGYSGDDCEHQVSACAPNPCRNGGACADDGGGGVSCACAAGFVGARCETNVDDCSTHPCANGATCIDEVNGFRCQCVPGYVGRTCGERVDYCVAKPCANGGTCLQLAPTNDFKCRCAPGFAGKDCRIEINECESHPCQNGGVCINRLHGFECTCPLGYVGKACEEVATSAAPSARVSSDATTATLSTQHVAVIVAISTIVPCVVLVAVAAIVCLKRRRKREHAKADEEARLQNEQNTAHSSFAKRGGVAISTDAHMIKNSWGKCTNVLSVPAASIADDGGVSGEEGVFLPKPIDGAYALQRSRSQKQLNTELGPRASSALLAAKLRDPDFEHMKRLSVMSNTSAVLPCGVHSDPALLKRPVEKETNGCSGGGVFVIDEHFHHRPNLLTDAGLFATEV